MKDTIALVSIAALLSIAGCKKDTDTEARMPTTTTGGTMAGTGILSNDEGMMRLIEARCDRAVACEDIGEGKRYPTKERCKQEVRQSVAADIGASMCPNGLREERVDACVSEVRGAKCSIPGDAIAQLAICRESALCAPR